MKKLFKRIRLAISNVRDESYLDDRHHALSEIESHTTSFDERLDEARAYIKERNLEVKSLRKAIDAVGEIE